MQLVSDQEHQVIREILRRHPDEIVSTTIELWERMAATLIPLIGGGGFQALYSRSWHLTSVHYPWMTPSHLRGSLPSGFSDLELSFAGQDSSQISEASIFLFITFIDILSTLIGELLATSVVRSAWGDDVFNITGEEPIS